MKRAPAISGLFLDIGGVLLTNGWDRHSRKRAASHFKLDLTDLDNRHRLTFGTYEEGKITLDEYLARTVFYRKQPFTRAAFRRFMFAQSEPHPRMIELVTGLKARYGLRVAVISNEGRELNAYRIRKFKLTDFVDCFVSSSYVHVRKPDEDIFRLALDISQVPVGEVVYIENTQMFTSVAEGLGIRSILHKDYESTCAQLSALGLRDLGLRNDE